MANGKRECGVTAYTAVAVFAGGGVDRSWQAKGGALYGRAILREDVERDMRTYVLSQHLYRMQKMSSQLRVKIDIIYRRVVVVLEMHSILLLEMGHVQLSGTVAGIVRDAEEAIARARSEALRSVS